MNVQALSRAIQQPADADPLRLPGFPAVEATGAVKYRQKATYTVGAPGVYTAPRIMMLRQPSYPLWGDVLNSSVWAVGRRFAMDSTITPSYTPSGAVEADLGVVAPVTTFKSIPAPVTGAGAAYTYGIRSSLIPAWGIGNALIGTTANSRTPWLYVPSDTAGVSRNIDVAAVFFRQTGQTTGVIAVPTRLTVEYWLGPGSVEQFTYNVTFTSQTALSPNYASLAVATVSVAAGFMRLVDINMGDADTGTTWNPAVGVGAPSPEFVDIWLSAPGGAAWSVSGTNVTAVGVSLTGLFPLIPPLDFSTDLIGQNIAPLASSRQTASSLSVANITKVTNKEGAVSAARLTFGADVFEFTTNSLNLPPMKSYYGPMESGVYSYVIPASSTNEWADYVFRDPVSGQWLASINLDQRSELNCFTFTDPDGSTSLMLRHDQHVEFVTASQAWMPKICRTTVETFHQALLQCITRNTFFPGPNGPRSRVGPGMVLAVRAAGEPRGGRRPRRPKNRGGKRPQGKGARSTGTQTHKVVKPKAKPKMVSKGV